MQFMLAIGSQLWLIIVGEYVAGEVEQMDLPRLCPPDPSQRLDLVRDESDPDRTSFHGAAEGGSLQSNASRVFVLEYLQCVLISIVEDFAAEKCHLSFDDMIVELLDRLPFILRLECEERAVKKNHPLVA